MISPPFWLGLGINVLFIAFVAYLFLTTYYVIEGNFLRVKSGFLINKIIDIHTIRIISETNNPIGAPAASLDRLEISYNKHDTILISPKDKSGFIDQILRINPQIEIRYRLGNNK